MLYIYIMRKSATIKSMGSIIVRDIDESIRMEYRILCMKRGISMNQAIKDFVKAEVEKARKTGK